MTEPVPPPMPAPSPAVTATVVPAPAATVVLLRSGPGGPEVLLIHRPAYDDWTVPELKNRAKELGLEGYSKLTKNELIHKIRNS